MPKAELPENQATGEPDALKGARPVRREAAETGPCGNRADRLPYLQPQPAKGASGSLSPASPERASVSSHRCAQDILTGPWPLRTCNTSPVGPTS